MGFPQDPPANDFTASGLQPDDLLQVARELVADRRVESVSALRTPQGVLTLLRIKLGRELSPEQTQAFVEEYPGRFQGLQIVANPRLDSGPAHPMPH